MALKLQIDQGDVLLQACKRSGDGKTSLTWKNDMTIKIWCSDLRELPLERLGTQVEVPAWELVTLRIDALNK